MSVDKSQFLCPSPFIYIVIIGDKVFNCQWLSKPIGTIDDDIEEIWNGPVAHEIRQSILNGSYKFCKDTCPRLCQLPKTTWMLRKDEIVDPFYLTMSGPQHMHLDTNRACNLHCPACRVERITKDKRRECVREKEILTQIADKLEVVSVCGSGEPFIAYMDVIEFLSTKDVKIKLATNGLLLKKHWHKVKNKVTEIQISIDAATPETYAKNRGGDWELLHENLQFAYDLLAQKKIEYLCFVMVVQQNNWREMKQFVEMSHRYGARAQFDRLMNWGTFTPEQYRSLDVVDKDHPEHEQLVALLTDPIFQKDTNLGNVQ